MTACRSELQESCLIIVEASARVFRLFSVGARDHRGALSGNDNRV